MGIFSPSSHRRPRLGFVAILAALVVLATACGQSNDPETWAEAEADGNLRENFVRACAEANAEGGDVEYYGGSIDADVGLTDVAGAVAGRDFAAFRELEDSLRTDPEDIPADVEALFRGCTDQALN